MRGLVVWQSLSAAVVQHTHSQTNRHTHRLSAARGVKELFTCAPIIHLSLYSRRTGERESGGGETEFRLCVCHVFCSRSIFRTRYGWRLWGSSKIEQLWMSREAKRKRCGSVKPTRMGVTCLQKYIFSFSFSSIYFTETRHTDSSTKHRKLNKNWFFDLI